MASRSRRSYDALVIEAGDMPAAAADPWWSDANGVGILAAVKASLDCGDLVSGAFDTVLEATTGGTAGDGLAFHLLADSGEGDGVTTTVTAKKVLVHFEPGVSTVGDVETAITALAGGEDIIGVKTSGTTATVLTVVDQIPETFLSGGAAAVTEGQGHVVNGLHPDFALLRITPGDWGSLTKVEVFVQQNDEGDGSGDWATPLAPLLPYAGTAKWFDNTGGALIVTNSLVAEETAILAVRCSGAQRFRFGLRATGAEDGSAAEFTCKVEFVRGGIYA